MQETLVFPEEALGVFLDAELHDDKKMVCFNSYTPQAVIGKFFLETGLDWPEECYQAQSNLDRTYKCVLYNDIVQQYQKKGVTKVYVDRHICLLIPVELIQMMNNYLLNEMRRVAPVLQQAIRTSTSFFTACPQDCHSIIAKHLQPSLSIVEAGKKMQKELANAEKFYQEMQHSFTYDKATILFSEGNGTCIDIIATAYFQTWFSTCKQQDKINVAEGFILCKIDKNTIVINKGFHTPGIQIQRKEGALFCICNNRKADENVQEREAYCSRMLHFVDAYVVQWYLQSTDSPLTPGERGARYGGFANSPEDHAYLLYTQIDLIAQNLHKDFRLKSVRFEEGGLVMYFDTMYAAIRFHYFCQEDRKLHSWCDIEHNAIFIEDAAEARRFIVYTCKLDDVAVRGAFSDTHKHEQNCIVS
jgi:hypothetical protein